MALFRALESAKRPAGNRLFEDPLAYSFLRPSLRAVVHLSRVPAAGRIIPLYIDRRWPGARTAGIARTRLIDDAVRRALPEVAQVVLLGSGFDSRAYRMPGMGAVRVFEVDSPVMLDRKRQVVSRAIGALPDNVVFVPIDFEQRALEEALRDKGFDAAARAFVVWEGVTSYLTPDAIDATLRSITALAADGTAILFTYLDRRVLEAPQEFEGGTRLAAIVERVGEPWKFGFRPAEVAAYLSARGLSLVEDVGAEDVRARYMGGARRNTKGYEFYRVALAAVGPDRAESGRALLTPAGRE